ncbi:unnamed protein product [Haemonchus placei]|uniref:Uncharacterized protein n=1 Tax=Haemonchus placei TaxID=6290 RepID=A0A0N4X2K3_HAEPC|nr:unnamed protein product [Haemonchus placei]
MLFKIYFWYYRSFALLKTSNFSSWEDPMIQRRPHPLFEPMNLSLFLERLDAPIERIEIRLIDENSTSNAVLESAAARPQPLQPSAVGGDNTANAIDTNTGSDDQYDVRYKKVEYVSDVMLTRQDNSPTELVAARSPDINENTASTATGESPTHGDEATDENTPRTKARAWLSFSNGTPSDNDDIDVLAPEVEESSSVGRFTIYFSHSGESREKGFMVDPPS